MEVCVAEEVGGEGNLMGVVVFNLSESLDQAGECMKQDEGEKGRGMTGKTQTEGVPLTSAWEERKRLWYSEASKQLGAYYRTYLTSERRQ